jgi:hypothetical protein
VAVREPASAGRQILERLWAWSHVAAWEPSLGREVSPKTTTTSRPCDNTKPRLSREVGPSVFYGS